MVLFSVRGLSMESSHAGPFLRREIAAVQIEQFTPDVGCTIQQSSFGIHLRQLPGRCIDECYLSLCVADDDAVRGLLQDHVHEWALPKASGASPIGAPWGSPEIG